MNPPPQPLDLESAEGAERFYEDRYQRGGYMESWPDWKRERIRALIEGIGLPERGRALDFGCGNGVFTEVLVRALPGWEVFGVDLSRQAVENAARAVSSARFFVAQDAEAKAKQFDLVFTHHVLEHVPDLDEVLDRIELHTIAKSWVLHILPCGNPGSFEHGVCALRRNGIDPERGNRYFFEDEGHLRRLDTGQLRERYEARGYRLAWARYGGQYAAAINWITASGPAFVREFADPAEAVDPAAARRLARLRRRLLLIARPRQIRKQVDARVARGRLGVLAVGRLIVFLPMYLLGWALDRYWEGRVAAEWRNHAHEPGGSEMYLLFAREGGSG